MSLYATGTITGALNATTITGTGTKWSDAKLGITNGSVLFVSSNAGVDGVYQVKRVISDTSIELAQPIFKAFNASKYSIMVAESASTAAWSNQLAATLGYYQAQMDGWQQIMTGTGDIALTAPDGTKVTIKSFTALDKNKADKSSLGSASRADIGASLGNVMSVTQSGENSNGLGALYPNNQLNNEFNGARTGFFRQSAAQGADWYGNWGAGLIVNYSDPTKFLIFISQDSSIYASRLNGNSEVWRDKFWTSKNTTVTSDGTLKSASPIVNIFHDGTFETNEESEGAEVEHVSVGVYLIKNVLGMNADRAWGGNDGGFDIPKDKNGHALVWLDYKVESDGSILVKTYHRTYPDAPAFARNIKDGFEEGDPIDIPSDQFVSVRVEMPQDSVWNLAQKAAQEEMAQEEIAEE